MNNPRNRLRIRFAKIADMRLLGHRDLIRLYERALRRTGLVLRLSEGFHPKAKLSFPLALATGMEGTQEVMEVEFDGAVPPDQLQMLLQAQLPAGIELRSVTLPPPFSKKAKVVRVAYQLPVSQAHLDEVTQNVQLFHRQSPCLVLRPGRPEPLDAHAGLESFHLQAGVLEVIQAATQSAIAGPRDLLRALNMSFLEEEGAWWTRYRVELEGEPASAA